MADHEEDSKLCCCRCSTWASEAEKGRRGQLGQLEAVELKWQRRPLLPKAKLAWLRAQLAASGKMEIWLLFFSTGRYLSVTTFLNVQL